MIFLVLFAVLAIGVSFLCSVLEAALLSITPSFVARQKQLRPELHVSLADLKEQIDRPLAAILTLNTIAHTVGATGVGAQVAVIFGEAWLGVASAIMTLLILVVSEIIPKTIGATYWRSLAPFLPAALNVLSWVLSPFIWLSEQITQRIGVENVGINYREEIKALADIGHEHGAIDIDEVRVIANMLDLHEVSVSSVMTPRNVSVCVSPGISVAEFLEQTASSNFSRIPVIDADERAQGYVHLAELWHADPQTSIDSVMHPINVINDEESVEQVFLRMLHGRNHLGVVYDDMGMWRGVITMEDVIEAILGQEIVDETDSVADLRQYARQRWTRRIGIKP